MIYKPGIPLILFHQHMVELPDTTKYAKEQCSLSTLELGTYLKFPPTYPKLLYKCEGDTIKFIAIGSAATREYIKKGIHKKYWVSPHYAYSLMVQTEKDGFQMIFFNNEVDIGESRTNQYIEKSFMAKEQSVYSLEDSLKFLVGHRPLYSNFRRVRSDEDQVVQTKVKNLLHRLERHDVYISGHASGMEYLQDNEKVDYFGIGGEEKFAENVYGFAIFENNFAEDTETIIYYNYESRNGDYKLQDIPTTIRDGKIMMKYRKVQEAKKQQNRKPKINPADQGSARCPENSCLKRQCNHI
uniref:AlNc14C30G2826 protein n=1 Tax=Albugo laibachii Nc14 TaxID=890382 RepID=F0W7M0_9STRA|nr:AlNc14C30G2826 [Albugo laibachii Nc14]|eukprot:CCA17121.1 AlNc14C30G2826 [Albugo laibachii Nc14]